MMKLLAIDSSGMPASVAVMEDGILLAEYTVNFRRTHSQTLMPMLEEVRRTLDLNLDSLDAIAVAGGPGSFTGLRIGSATAKGIGLALNKPIIHVPTLEAMAYSYYGSDGLIVPMMDARRNQVFAGIYSFRFCRPRDILDSSQPQDNLNEQTGEDPLCVVMDQTPIDVVSLCEKLDVLSREKGKSVILSGDGAQVYHGPIEESMKSAHIYAPPHLAWQRAGCVAARAVDLARMGKLESAAQHRPEYLRVSQAERVRAENAKH